MDAGAADQASVDEGALRLGFFVRGLAESVGLKLGMIGEEIFAEDFYLVVSKVGLGEVGPLLEHDYAKTVRRKLLGKDAAGRAGADDDEVDFVGGFVLGLVGPHDLVLSACPEGGCQPG